MKKDVGMTTARKSKETRRMEMGSISQQFLHIRWVASDYSAVMYVYVGIVGWIYRTKIDPISILLISLLFEQWSSLHLFSFQEMFFPLLVPGLSFMVLAMYRVHSSMCMQGKMKEEQFSNSIAIFINESRCCVIVELYLKVEDAEIESTSRWIGESKIPELIQ